MTFSGRFDTPFYKPDDAPPVIPPPPTNTTGRFSAEVFVGAVDYSARITGQISVEAEESTARVAEFRYVPPVGPVDLNTWIGAAVFINYIDNVSSSFRLFTGVVSEVQYDPLSRIVTFQCHDDLQGYFETKTESEILALIPGGLYDDAVFGPRRDGWSQAQDIMSTVTSGVDLQRDAATLDVASWYDGAPRYQYSASTARFVEVDIARRRDITNQIVIDAGYRYSREHHREHDFYWLWNGLCEFIEKASDLPTRDMFNSVAQQLNWINLSGSVCYKTLPPDGFYCGDQGLVVTPEARDTLVIEAQWRAARRWSQTITESYQVTVQESGSIAGYGLLPKEDRSGLHIPNDDTAWDTSLEAKQPDSPTGGGTLRPFTAEDCGGSALLPGESWVWTSKTEDSRRVNFLNTIIAEANHKIRNSHRRNFVSWQSALLPDLERSNWMALATPQVSATGKVFHYRHVLDFDAQTALTTIKLAISKAPAGGIDNPITIPAAPDTESGYVEPERQTVLPSYYGGDDAAPEYDETWEGFTGNHGVAQGNPNRNQIYPRRVQVTGPDVEATSRNEIAASSVTTQEIQVPDQTLVIA